MVNHGVKSMDIASLIGLLGAAGMIAGAMVSAGGIGMYVDVPSMLIVLEEHFLQLCTDVNFLNF